MDGSDKQNHISNLYPSYLESLSSRDSNYTHLLNCWRIENCGSCVSSKHSCGWCPYSAVCVPMEKTENLLSPVRNANICPLPWQERYELRTKTLGCNCSTTTFLAALITCLCTIVAIPILWLFIKAISLLAAAWRGDRNGYLIEIHEDGSEVGKVWVRKYATWKGWWSHMWRKDSEVVVREEEDLLG